MNKFICLNVFFKKVDLHYWDTDVTGPSEKDLETLVVKNRVVMSFPPVGF